MIIIIIIVIIIVVVVVIIPPAMKLGGVYWIHLVCLSVCPSVR